jgi:hypothetical protein
MDPQPTISTSFIPKKSMIRAPGRTGAGVFMVAAIVLFIVSLIAAGGAYYYRSYLTDQKTQFEADLQRSQAAFEPALLAELERFDSRLNVSNGLLAKHVTILPFFNFLEQETLKTIRYKTLNISLFQEKNSEINVKLTGEAESYESIALQSDVFVQTKKLSPFVFSGLSPTPTGRVSFELSGTVDPSLFSYASTLSQ